MVATISQSHRVVRPCQVVSRPDGASPGLIMVEGAGVFDRGPATLDDDGVTSAIVLALGSNGSYSYVYAPKK